MKFKTIKAVTSTGRIGTAYETDLVVWSKVKHRDGRQGTYLGEGLAGMPEVRLESGHTVLWFPSDIVSCEPWCHKCNNTGWFQYDGKPEPCTCKLGKSL